MRQYTRLACTALTALVTISALAASAAMASSGYQYSVEERTVYGYTVYSDYEKTNQIDYVTGHCVGDGEGEFAAQPFVSTPYYDKEKLYICQGGPYLEPG